MNASLMSNGTILGIDLGKYKSVILRRLSPHGDSAGVKDRSRRVVKARRPTLG
jgi:hypothetical protein